MTEHLELDALADVLAGGPAPDHLDTCAACREKLARLEAALPAVSRSLEAVALPAEPAGLAERIEATLAAQRPAGDATVVPLTTRRRTRWLPALAAVAASAAVVLGGVLVLQSGDDDPDRTTTFAVSSTGTDYAKDGKALRAALPRLLQGQREAAPEIAADMRAGTPQGATASPEAGILSAPAADPLAALRTDEGLAACLLALTDPEDPEAGLPLALDYASFQGQPALVVVLPTAKTDRVDVFVVGAGCNQQDAQLLFFTRLPSP